MNLLTERKIDTYGTSTISQIEQHKHTSGLYPFIPGSLSRGLLQTKLHFIFSQTVQSYFWCSSEGFIGLLHWKKNRLSRRAMYNSLNIEFQISLPLHPAPFPPSFHLFDPLIEYILCLTQLS